MQAFDIQQTKQALLALADDKLILGQRLAEWCGHGPVLEIDIAMTNIALDLLGQSRLLYQLIIQQVDNSKDEDQLAMMRDERHYYNLLLVEQENGDFGKTILRQFLYDSYHLLYLQELKKSADQSLLAYATKTEKEVKYHYKFSSEWVIRLGDGTDESNARMRSAADDLIPYSEEMFQMQDYEKELVENNVLPNVESLQASVTKLRQDVFAKANIPWETLPFYQKGGRNGTHSENMGHILTELQYMQRTYPNMTW